MLNRRHIRIKVMQALYAHHTVNDGDIVRSEKALLFSFEKMREMYIYLFMLLVEMQTAAIEKIEAGLAKKLPTEDDLKPNTKFVTNPIIRLLVNSKNLQKAAEDTGASWADQKDLMKQMFRQLIETEDYKEYMASDERSFTHHREYLLRFFKRHLINVELLHDFFEEKSIFWNDDLDLVASMAIKTLKTIEEKDTDLELLGLWKEGEEREEKEFAIELFRKSISMSEEHEKLIQNSTKNWEIERLATLDTILLKMGLAEAKSFETVPLKVTLNEYIELSKYYSTPKSNGFINGVLDQLFTKLKEDGSIKKIGRGLLQ
jgi:N utilization substance protein B